MLPTPSFRPKKPFGQNHQYTTYINATLVTRTYSPTADYQVYGEPEVMHSKSLRELPTMTYETLKCQQKGY